MTANLNLMTKHLSPILPLTRTASRVSAVWFEPLLKACDFLFAARVAFWVILTPRRDGSPAILILWSSHLVLLAKHHARCVLWKSKLAQIALVGPRINLQKSQRDMFTRELPWLDTNTFGVPVAMKLSLTPGFVQGIASTLHSSFRMPAWELVQWKMARKHSYKPTTYRLELVCAREQNKQRLKLVTSQKTWVLGILEQRTFQGRSSYRTTKYL